MNVKTGVYRVWMRSAIFFCRKPLAEVPPPLQLLNHDRPESVSGDERQRLAATVFDNSREAIMIVDPQLRIVQVNRAFSQITGYRADEVVGQKPSMLSSGRHDEARESTPAEGSRQEACEPSPPGQYLLRYAATCLAEVGNGTSCPR